MTDDPDQAQSELANPRAARMLISNNLKRLRLAAMVTQKALAEEIDVDVTALSALELGHGFLPIKTFPLLATAFGISFHELIIELGKDESLAVHAVNKTVADMAALTPDRVEIIRLRDAIEEERRTAERQFELLANRRGMVDIFTREAARRLERLTFVLETGSERGEPRPERG